MAVVPLACVDGTVGNPVFLAPGLAFAAAFTIRIGAATLADRPVGLGGGNPDVPSPFGMGEGEDLATQKRIAAARKQATQRNARTLKGKHGQNGGITATSLMLPACLMGMAMLFMAIAPQPAWGRPPRRAPQPPAGACPLHVAPRHRR